MHMKKNIGVMGLNFQVGNKGCEALSYGFMELLDQIAREENDRYNVLIFASSSNKGMLKFYLNPNTQKRVFPRYPFDHLDFTLAICNMGIGKKRMDTDIRKCDVIFDFTAGDSFTDIYGKERFFSRSEIKKRVIELGVPLVLGNQTIGPFNDVAVQEIAKEIILRSYDVITRDRLSFQYVQQLTGRTPFMSTDIAFYLPYYEVDVSSDKIKVGLNPSGLLWCGGYNGKNQFGLTVDYQAYCKDLIWQLLDSGKYDVYLIPHAASQTDSSKEAVGYRADNDMIACNALHELFPKTKRISVFEGAVEAKSFISKMDVFTGARMHATIAAYSSKVPVIPFSYSRKFEGLYETLEYPYVISARQVSTQEAVAMTLEYIADREKLSDRINAYQWKQDDVLDALKDRVRIILKKT